MARIPAENAAKGRYAEVAFRAWLIESKLGYLEVDQTHNTLPAYLRRIVKRPDFLVGILSVGMVAVDVKARTPVLQGYITIDADEYDSFRVFERYFGIPVWYACYVDRQRRSCFLFRNADINAEKDLTTLQGKPVMAVPIDLMTCVAPDETFDTALLRASRERLA